MNVEQALKEVGRYEPCPHYSLDTSLGNGSVWARCDDCGETIQQKSIERLRKANDRFNDALSVLSNNLKASGTEQKVCGDVVDRQQLGIAKYGQTVAENPLSLREWLQHAYEECLDQAIYLKRAIEEIDNGNASENSSNGKSKKDVALSEVRPQD